MSRIGKLPISLPTGTSARMDGEFLVVKGPKGELREKIHPLALVELAEQEIKVNVAKPDVKKERAIWGLFRTLINNMVIGVNQGYEKKLEINGVGYRAAVAGNKLTLNVGFSHPVDFTLPEGVVAAVAANVITLNSIDKYLLGETAAQIRKVRKPEPYKGKGIKYSDEVIRRKAGKTAAKGGK
ncbi:50S ribosomal protein L6 [Candidatus Falkowbacteria bacterium]|nr:50S ribosomal protein L6 [Candidatus Falkowbacteria bacterium]